MITNALKRKTAAVTSCDGLDFFSTTHPASEGQGNVPYHINDARHKSY